MQRSSDVSELRVALDSPEPDAGFVAVTMAGLIDSWLSGEELPRAIAHPLGFLYIPLHRAASGTLRLHIWSADGTGSVPLTSPYHRHTWTLRSHVLAGRVTNELPSVVCTHSKAEYRLYDITGHGGVDTMRPSAITVRKDPGRSETFAAGDTYAMPAGEFHATTCPDGAFAATLCQVEPVEGLTEVTLGPLQARAIEQRRESAPGDQVRGELENLRQDLRRYARVA